MIDIACLVVVGLVAYFVSNEGAWGAAHLFLSVLIAALVSMNFFEPLAVALDGLFPSNFRRYSDIIAILGLFIGMTFGLRLVEEKVAPVYIVLPSTIDQIGKWAFGVLTGYLTMAFLLVSVHTSPLPREFMGFQPERNNFFGSAPDRQWLGFFQYVTEKSFSRIKLVDPKNRQYVTHAFDARFEQVGDKTKPYPNSIWPSFPIRYAMHREKLETNQPVTAPVPTTSVPRPATPASTTPSGNPGF